MKYVVGEILHGVFLGNHGPHVRGEVKGQPQIVHEPARFDLRIEPLGNEQPDEAYLLPLVLFEYFLKRRHLIAAWRARRVPKVYDHHVATQFRQRETIAGEGGQGKIGGRPPRRAGRGEQQQRRCSGQQNARP